MSKVYEITRKNMCILVAAATVLSVLLVIFGFVLGRNIAIPEPFPSVDTITGGVDAGSGDAELPEEIRSLRTSTGDDTSGKPFVDNEKLSFYDTLDLDGETERQDVGKGASEGEVRDLKKTVSRQENGTPVPIATASPTPDPFATASPDFDTAYVVQVHSVRNRKYAEKARDDLSRKGYPSYISKIRFNTGIINYRVRVGPYAERDAADTIKERIRREFHQSPLVMVVRDGSS